jgi:hypothetical protein
MYIQIKLHVPWFPHSLTHSLTHSLAHSLTHSPTHSLTHSKLQGLIFLFCKFACIFLSSFYFSKFYCTSHQPISVADFSWRVNRVTCFTSLSLQYLSFFVNINVRGGGCSSATFLLGVCLVNTIMYNKTGCIPWRTHERISLDWNLFNLTYP